MENKIRSIELFYFDACPSWKETLGHLREILEEMNIIDEVKLIRVETDDDAVSHQFPGSPTIKINGHDIFPTKQDNYALGCRIYETPDGFKGSPSKEMIREKFSQIINH
jgi:hypothetical protein